MHIDLPQCHKTSTGWPSVYAPACPLGSSHPAALNQAYHIVRTVIAERINTLTSTGWDIAICPHVTTSHVLVSQSPECPCSCLWRDIEELAFSIIQDGDEHSSNFPTTVITLVLFPVSFSNFIIRHKSVHILTSLLKQNSSAQVLFSDICGIDLLTKTNNKTTLTTL